MDKSALADAALAPANPFARVARRRHLAVLAYHDVPNRDVFAQQLDHLADRYQPVSLEELHRWGRGELPANAVLVTFDDGDRTVMENALPELERRRIPAVAFVVAGIIDTDDAPWWLEVERLSARLAEDGAALVRELKMVPDVQRRTVLRELRERAGDRIRVENLSSEDLVYLESSGVTVGNHSWSHPLLDRCEDETVIRELGRAHEFLSDVLGRPPRTLAYPNGNVDGRAVAAARRLGYETAFLFDHRITSWPPPDPLRVSRVRAGADVDLPRFRSVVSGAHPLVHRILGRS